VSAALKLAVKKHVPCVLIVGENEAREQRVTLRNLGRGEEYTIDQDAALRTLLAQESVR
jgi:histidyl-tRNA synthetase